jgi:hypothetical protein
VAGAVLDIVDVDSDGADVADADPVVVDDVDSESSSVHALTVSRPVTSTAAPPRQRSRVIVQILSA